MLPPQLIFQGKTDRVHPTIELPEGWNVTHTLNHWSDEKTLIEHAELVLKPYREKVIQELGLPSRQRGLYILDVYKPHLTEPVRTKLHEVGFEVYWKLYLVASTS